VPREARGTVKSVDAKTGVVTITTTEPGRDPVEKQFTLAKDAEIAIGDGLPRRGALAAGKIDDLAKGSIVGLSLADDDKTVTSVLVQGPTVRGMVQSVDAAKKQLKVTVFPQFGGPQRDQQPEEKTYKVADGAEIGIDDGRGRRFSIAAGKLADVTAGVQVTMQLTPDQKEVQSLVAEAPTLTGTVKSAGDDKLSVTFGPQRGDEAPEEKTLDVATDAVVWLDDGRGRRLSLTVGKLADVPAGATVRVRLAPDQKLAVQITAEGPNLPGLVKSVDAEKRTITVATFNRDRQPEEKTYAVADDARVVIDNAPGKLDEIKPADNGPFASLRLSLDQKTAQAITINTNR
jgi:hypothetical protein